MDVLDLEIELDELVELESVTGYSLGVDQVGFDGLGDQFLSVVD